MSSTRKKNLIRAIGVGLVLAAIGAITWYALHPTPRSPEDIRRQVSFTILAPGNKDIVLSDWQYNVAEKTLTYTATLQSKKVIITQSTAPLAYKDDRAAYDRFIGSLKPFAVFMSPLGNVSVIHMLKEENYAPGGDSALLLAKDTLLIAHPPQAITEDDWLTLFSTMRAE